jgi:hypothetical protein
VWRREGAATLRVSPSIFGEAVLRIFGFQLEDKFVDYVKVVMEAAVDLKDIYPYEMPMCEKNASVSCQRTDTHEQRSRGSLLSTVWTWIHTRF